MQFKFGIREKLLVPLLLGLGIIIFVLFFLWQPNQLKKAKKQFIESQTNILKTLAPSVIQNYLSNDLAELYGIFKNSQLIHKNEWRYIQLNDPKNKQLYPLVSKKHVTSDALIKITLPIEESGEILGKITLYTDWEESKNKELENNRYLSIMFILLFVAIGIVSFILHTKWIYIPILKLKQITSLFSIGDYDTRLPEITNDEIGLLTSSIAQMRDKIQLSMNELIDGEKKQRAILESVPDAIITINRKGIIQSFNPGAESIFLYTADEVIEKNIKTLMPDEFSQHHDQYLKEFKISNTQQVLNINRKLFGKRKGGEQFPIDLTINAKTIDSEILVTGIIRDMTEQRKVERLKSEFVSTVSHELRTPLTAIKGSLDIMTNGLAANIPLQPEKMLEIANRNVERLLILINDILDISKLESEEINFTYELTEINSFIKSSVELNQEYAKKHKTRFTCVSSNENAIVNIDKNRLNQVMSNLLSNAAKYSPANIDVEISIYINNETVRVNVKDYGPGIPEEFQPVLFEKFTQSSSGDTRKVGGTGLGLNISKIIINKLGGEIYFETVINKETSLYFELPIVNKV